MAMFVANQLRPIEPSSCSSVTPRSLQSGTSPPSWLHLQVTLCRPPQSTMSKWRASSTSSAMVRYTRVWKLRGWEHHHNLNSSWCLVKILKIKFDQDLELAIWPIEVTLIRRTQPLGPLCVWQCFNSLRCVNFCLSELLQYRAFAAPYAYAPFDAPKPSNIQGVFLTGLP